MKLPYEDIDLDLEKVSNFNTLGDKIIIKSFTKEHLLINKKLKLCPAVLRCLYLTLGDGSLQKGVYLSNINYRAHKEFIEIFNSYFNINKKDFVISLTVNEKTNGRNINKSKKYWLNSLKIQRIDRFYFTKFNTCPQGGVKTIYDNKNLSALLIGIFDHIKEIIFNNKINKVKLCHILDGILNAEGGASIDYKKWGLHKVTISFNQHNKEEKDLFYTVLKNLGLSNSIKLAQERRYEISKWHNQYKFIKVFVENDVMPFSLSPKKGLTLSWGFLNHQRTKSMYNYLKAIEKSHNLKEVREFLNYHRSSIEKTLLKKFDKFGLFKVDRSTKPYNISLTKEGQFFLRVIEKLQGWLILFWDMFIEDNKLKQEVGMKEDVLPYENLEREVLVVKESQTNPAYGCKPEERPVEKLIDYGVINVNKQSGPTSHQVADYVKKILGVEKAGHSGTLETRNS